jgi:hypothetical protein
MLMIRRSLSNVSHSQMTTTRQLFKRSCRTALRSRARLRSNFSIQKLARVFGVVARRHLGCRCQKQPWTKITVRQRGRTRSGRPAKEGLCNRKRYPSRWTALRTARSGTEFLPRTRRIKSERSRVTGGSVSSTGLVSLTFFFRAPGAIATI